jgi:DNA/RNA endonuclease G (NUC1)
VSYFRAVESRVAQRCKASLLVCFTLLGLGSATATIGIAHQMLLGNPSNATADTNNHNHFLIQREVQALDYSDTLRQPNWASWHLTAEDIGSSGRSPVFFVDTNLPASFYWVATSDYSGSGYDRGHLCPSADRTDTREHNDETFLMSNIIPQSPDNNQGVWANLETYCRTLAQADNEVLITCGPEGFSGARTASAGLIYIPSNVWKIVVVVPPGSGPTLERITAATRVIAVNIPNIAGVRSDPWQNHLTSVNQLQTNTSFTFFSALDSNLAAVLRAKVDGAPATDIAGFTPTSGAASSTVVITGTNLAGATAVKFNGTSATFTQDSATQLTAFVPVGVATGPISVIASGGLATSTATFNVATTTPLPVSLTIAREGDKLLITWPAATGYCLQQNPDLNPTNWTSFTGTLVTGTNNVVTLPAPAGNLFFRLIRQ